MNLVERMIFQPKGGMFREFEGLTTHFEARDAGLYRQLLPDRLTMPARPIVTIFVADYKRLVPWPKTGYKEWSLMLSAEMNGKAGWHAVTMPVTYWSAMLAGRYLGFPKFITNEIILTRTSEGVRAEAKYRNEIRLRLEFHPGLTRPLEPWEQELVENPSFFKGDNLQLVPPARGPRMRKVSIAHMAPAQWSPEAGMIRVWASPSESWRDLVPEDGEFPGTYNQFTGGFNLESDFVP